MAQVVARDIAQDITQKTIAAGAKNTDDVIASTLLKSNVLNGISEQTIKEAAGKTAKEAAEQTVKETAEKAAKEISDKAAQEAAKIADNVVEKTFINNNFLLSQAKNTIATAQENLTKSYNDISTSLKGITDEVADVADVASQDIYTNLSRNAEELGKPLEDLTSDSIVKIQQNIGDLRKEIAKLPAESLLTKKFNSILDNSSKLLNDTKTAFLKNSKEVNVIKINKKADEVVESYKTSFNLSDIEIKRMKNFLIENLDKVNMNIDKIKLPKYVDSVANVRATNEALATSRSYLKNAFETVTTTEGRANLIKVLSGLGVLAAIGYLGYVIIDPKVQMDKINNANYVITSVAIGSTPNSILITYDPSQQIDKTDVVKLSQSFLLQNNFIKSNVLEIINIINSAQIEIKGIGDLNNISTLLPLVPSSEYKYGLLKIETNYNTQLKKITSEFGKTVGGAVGGAASGAGAGLGGLTSGLFESIFGFKFPFSMATMCIICIVIILLFSFGFIFFIFLK
jgi:hypothetical protein